MNVARPPFRRALARFSILAVSVALVASAAWAEPADESKPKSPDKPATAENAKADEVKVYTNKDLARLFPPDPAEKPAGETPPAGATDPRAAATSPRPAQRGGQTPPADQDPLEWLKNRQEAQASRQSRIDEAQAELFAAEEKLANLKKELLATVNPFSARPKLSDEEKEYRRTSGETALERNERVKALEQEAQQAVDEARANLERVKRE